MDYGLAPNVSFCRFPDRWIFLDVVRDRYVAAPLGPVATDHSDQPEPSPRMIDQLIEAGLMARGHHARPLESPSIEVPLASLTENNAERSSAMRIPAVVTSLVSSRRNLRICPLAWNLNKVSTRKRSSIARSPGHHELAALVASFHSVRRLLPFAPRCLPDSLALLSFLHRFGHYPTLTFGVMAHPFAAHCWVQDETRLLNDAYGHARQFTPILVI
jgi:hypothetical protein